MSDKSGEKRASRAIQKETGMVYSQCLHIVRGLVEYVPVDKGTCVVERALGRLRRRPTSENKAPCHCAGCDP